MVNLKAFVLSMAVPGLVTSFAGSARADYHTQPELRPSVRCAGFEDSDDCQPLFWDLPAATSVGQRATAAPLPEHPDFPGGMTDRPPPLYTDGIEGYESFDAGVSGLHPLCPDPADPARADPRRVPHWKRTGETATVTDLDGQPRDAVVYEVACHDGSRAHYGPVFVGQDPRDFDLLAYKLVVFENSARVGAAHRELDVGSEIYGHVGAHHGTCYVSTHECADASDPEYAASSACDGFRSLADECPAEGPSVECPSHGFVAFRSTTSRQGRYEMSLPPGKAFGVTEDPMWLCQYHLVSEEPPGYGGTGPRNFRRQPNGTVGEMVLQMLTEPWATDGYTPVSMTFDFIASNATTLIPPFTAGVQDTVWYAPFDLAIGMITMHSHENMVRGSIDVLPAGAPRLGSSNPACGGSTNGLPAAHAYQNDNYFEPQICEYWRETDGPIVLRKGQAIHASCLVNNGVTPSESVPDPTLRDALRASPVGTELYGRQSPSAYRVRYGCERTPGLPPGRPLDGPARDCPSNPQKDSTGGVVDGPYDAPDYCPRSGGNTGRCVPANVVFANTGEDAMCIPILMYWPLERIVGSDGSVDQDAVDRTAAGDVDEVGTPGRVWRSPSDSGVCHDGSDGAGPAIADPALFGTGSRTCSAGL